MKEKKTLRRRIIEWIIILCTFLSSLSITNLKIPLNYWLIIIISGIAVIIYFYAIEKYNETMEKINKIHFMEEDIKKIKYVLKMK